MKVSKKVIFFAINAPFAHNIFVKQEETEDGLALEIAETPWGQITALGIYGGFISDFYSFSNQRR